MPALINEAAVRTSTRPGWTTGTGTSATVPSPVLKFCRSCFIGASAKIIRRLRRLHGFRIEGCRRVHLRLSIRTSSEKPLFLITALCVICVICGLVFLAANVFSIKPDTHSARASQVPSATAACRACSRSRIVFVQSFFHQTKPIIVAARNAQDRAHRFIFRQRRNHHRLSRRQIFPHLDRRTITGKRVRSVPRQNANIKTGSETWAVPGKAPAARKCVFGNASISTPRDLLPMKTHCQSGRSRAARLISS